MQEERSSGEAWTPKAGKLAHRLAHMIELNIAAGTWPAGKNLGSEAELAVQYGVGRDVVRQALALVSRGGLAQVRRGNVGGLVVTTPSADAAARGLRNFLDLEELDWPDIMGARRRLEDLLLMQAIDRQRTIHATRYRKLLDELSETMDERARFTFAAQMFHALADAARNPFLSIAILTLLGLSWARFRMGAEPRQAVQLKAIAELRMEQLRAVYAADAGRALFLNGKMFEIYAEIDVVGSMEAAQTAETFSSLLDAPPKRLSDYIVQDIKRRIVKGELAPGDRIGSEAQLIERYGASKGVIRNAARILERLSIAMASRGKGGGLFVTKPRADSVLLGATLCMRSQQQSAGDLAAVGNVLGLYAIELTAQKVACGDEAQRQRIAQRLSSAEPDSVTSSFPYMSAAAAASECSPLVLLVALSGAITEVQPKGAVNAASLQLARDVTRSVLLGDGVEARRAFRSFWQNFDLTLKPADDLPPEP